MPAGCVSPSAGCAKREAAAASSRQTGSGQASGRSRGAGARADLMPRSPGPAAPRVPPLLRSRQGAAGIEDARFVPFAQQEHRVPGRACRTAARIARRRSGSSSSSCPGRSRQPAAMSRSIACGSPRAGPHRPGSAHRYDRRPPPPAGAAWPCPSPGGAEHHDEPPGVRPRAKGSTRRRPRGVGVVHDHPEGLAGAHRLQAPGTPRRRAAGQQVAVWTPSRWWTVRQAASRFSTLCSRAVAGWPGPGLRASAGRTGCLPDPLEIASRQLSLGKANSVEVHRPAGLGGQVSVAGVVPLATPKRLSGARSSVRSNARNRLALSSGTVRRCRGTPGAHG